MSKEFSIKVLIILAIILLIISIGYFGTKLFYFIKDRQGKSILNVPSITEAPVNKFDALIIADTSHSIQTKFFRESANHALEVVKGKEPVPQEDINFKGKDILETLKFMNDDAKSNIYIAIQYMLISKPDSEESMRQLSYKDEIPMWMVIIRQAMLQTIPNVNFPSCAINPPLTVSFSKTA